GEGQARPQARRAYRRLRLHRPSDPVARRSRAPRYDEDRHALLIPRVAGMKPVPSLRFRQSCIMGRKILFITTDQMRFDAIGANGQTIARTPHIDALARDGINYTSCHAK